MKEEFKNNLKHFFAEQFFFEFIANEALNKLPKTYFLEK